MFCSGIKCKKVRQTCTGSGSMRQGVTEMRQAAQEFFLCPMRQERVLITTNSLRHCRGCKRRGRFGEHDRVPPVRHPVRFRLAVMTQWKRRNLKPILRQQKPSIHQQNTKSPPTKTKSSPRRTKSAPSRYQAVTKCYQLKTKP